MSKSCRRCGAAFDGHHNARFCGDACRKEFQAEYIKVYKKEWNERRKKPRPEYHIDPFPADIDRNEFGGWLSGFIDGEGTFGLRRIENKDRIRFQCAAHLRVTLRDDDTDTLKLIQSYWGCGRIYFADNVRSKTPNAKPITIYSVQKVNDIRSIILTHFERHPLRAKKRHDLVIWKQGIEMMSQIQSRPWEARPGVGGCVPRWTAAERERFALLSAALREQRRYAPADLTPALYS